jgi:hypothetical protein
MSLFPCVTPSAACVRTLGWLTIFEVQLGLAGRIGEILSLTVDDLNLDHEDSPRVHTGSTVIVPNGQRPQVRLHTKDGPDGRCTVIVHDSVAEILRNRALLAGTSRGRFESRNGTLLKPHNVRESWRKVPPQPGSNGCRLTI